MRIPRPFIPLRVESGNCCHTVHVIDRDYTFGPDGLPTSIVSQGHELLAAPMRVVCVEDGQPSGTMTIPKMKARALSRGAPMNRRSYVAQNSPKDLSLMSAPPWIMTEIWIWISN